MLRTLPLLGWVLISGADCWVLIGQNEVHGHTGSSLSVMCFYEGRYQNNTTFWCRQNCWVTTDQNEIHGHTGSSLSVKCFYEKRYQYNTKFWCKQSELFSTCDRSFLIKSISDKKVKDGRVSIEDNRMYAFFKVTMDDLQLDDSGTYQCGVEHSLSNTRREITVTVSPATTLKPVITEPPGPDPAKKTTTDVTKSTLTPKLRSSKPDVILIYCIVGVFSLLLLATVVLIIMTRKKKTGSCVRRKKEAMPLNTGTLYSTVDGPRRNIVLDHPTSTNEMGLYSNTESNPESNGERIHSQRKALERRNEVTYATLMISDLQQDAIYTNIDPTTNPSIPQSSTQDVFYTEVKKSPEC